MMNINKHSPVFIFLGVVIIIAFFVLPATAAVLVDLEIVSSERPYGPDNPVTVKKAPDFKLGKGWITTTYEIDSYPAVMGPHNGWGRKDEGTYIPYLYHKERITTPSSGAVVGQPYKEVNTFEVTESLGDMLFTAWLKAPAVCISFQNCAEGTQLTSKQKFKIEITSNEGGGNTVILDDTYPDLEGYWEGASGRGNLGTCQVIQDGNSLTFINENGQTSSGRFIDANTVIATDWENGLQGTIAGDRINWENNTWWTKGSDNSYPDLEGYWEGASGRGNLGTCQVIQDGNSLTFINEHGQSSSGRFIDANTVIATDWENGLEGTIEGNRINWENNTWWTR